MYSEKVIKQILNDVQTGALDPRAAFQKLKHLPYETLSCARIDHHRSLRKGMPEVVYAAGKTREQLMEITASFLRKKVDFVVTRLNEDDVRALQEIEPKIVYNVLGKIAFLKKRKKNNGNKRLVAVVTAGTCDIPVAEEAAVILDVLGCTVERIYDCGVAGIHRLIDHVPALNKAQAVVCVAGMEGALPSVLGGLIETPIVAVPTSVGYGTNFGGLTALFTMLNSCAQGVAVMNVDNGFGAGVFASMIAK